MLNRREWLTATTALAAWPRVQVSAAPTRIPSPPAGAPDDEAFWSDVRGAFELTSERINLVTVVRGITTKTTRESAAAESARVNTFRADGGPPAEWRLDVRRKAAAFIGAPVESVALLRNTTEGVATVVNNWPLDRGDELLTSSAEHGPYNDLFAARAARDGLTVRKFNYPAPATSLDAIADAVEGAMTPRTRLVMIGQVVLTGQITPVRQIADRVRARGAKLLVDGVLGIGHVPLT